MSLEEKRVSQRIGFISFGFFLILVGLIWINTPDLEEAVVAFFRDLHLAKAFDSVYLPAPKHTYSHAVVYGALQQFCIGYGFFQVAVLILRFAFGSPISDKAGTVSGILFWLSFAFLIGLLLNEAVGWFTFIAGFIIVVGLTIIVRGLAQIIMHALST